MLSKMFGGEKRSNGGGRKKTRGSPAKAMMPTGFRASRSKQPLKRILERSAGGLQVLGQHGIEQSKR